jgi:hypothetical protein
VTSSGEQTVIAVTAPWAIKNKIRVVRTRIFFHGRSSVEAKAVCHRFAKSEEAAKKIVPGQ